MNGRLTSVCMALESSIFAASAASRRRCTANLSADKSMPNWLIIQGNASCTPEYRLLASYLIRNVGT